MRPTLITYNFKSKARLTNMSLKKKTYTLTAYTLRQQKCQWVFIHILTGNEVTGVRLFSLGPVSDQKSDLYQPAEVNRPLFWSLTGPMGNRRTLVTELCQ